MNEQKIRNVIEAALLSAGRPLEPNEILRLFDETDRPTRKDLRAAIDTLSKQYEGSAVELREVAGGFRTQVRAEFGEYLVRLTDRRPPRYSRALMETLALVAYRQPVTRGEIEEVRGVSVSTNIVRTLLERGWIRIVGHRDVPGRPAMLGTTKEFLDYFNLKTLGELPSLSELKDFDSINVELDFEGAQAALIDEEGESIDANDGDEAADDGLSAVELAADEQFADEEEASAEHTDDAEDDGADSQTPRAKPATA